MADRLVSVDDNFDFPDAVAHRLAARFRDTSTPEGAAMSATKSMGALSILRAGIAMRNIAAVPIVFTGSSTTAGVGASTTSLRYVNIIAQALQSAYPMRNGSRSGVRLSHSIPGSLPLPNGIHVFNTGVGGTTTGTYLEEPKRSQIVQLRPRVIFHMIGSNDNWNDNKSAADYKRDVKSSVDYFRSNIPGPLVQVLIHQQERMDKPNLVPWAEYGDALSSIAAESPDDVAFINVADDFAKIGVPGADPLNLVIGDNIHLSDAGHALLADLILSKLGIIAPPQTYSLGSKVRSTSDNFTGATTATLWARATDAAAGGDGENWSSSNYDVFAIKEGRLVPGAVAAAGFAAVTRPSPKVETSVRVNSFTGPSFMMLVAIRDALAGPQNQVRVAIREKDVSLVATLAGVETSRPSIPYTHGKVIGIRVDGRTAELLIDGSVVDTLTMSAACPGAYTGIVRGEGIAVFNFSEFAVDGFVS